MRVSTYFANTLPEAMAKVRAELGAAAIVLSWRNVRGGVEISASVQADTPRQMAPAKAPPMPREETFSHHFSEDDFGVLPPQRVAPSPQRPVVRPPSQVRPPQRGMGALLNRQSAPPLSPPAIATKPRPTEFERKPEPHATAPATGSRLKAFLMRAGLTAGQALVLGTAQTPELRRALIESLSKALRFEPIEAIPPKPILLVGPPGAGKSACAAKLAARTLAAGHEVLLISADAERCGGADQLSALAKRLGTRFATVTTLFDLNQTIVEARQRGLVVYVDAPAASPTQPADMRATQRMIEETRLEPVLCLPADVRPDDMEDLATAYAQLGTKRAIITRMDLTNRRASALHCLQVADIALAQISATPYISGGVAIGTAQRLANLLLEPFEDALADSHVENAA